MVVAWSRKSYLGRAEIASFVLLVLFKDGVSCVSFVSDVKGMRRRSEFKILLCDLGDGKTLLRSSASC